MEIGTIKDLSNDIIFREIEKEAENKYCSTTISMKNNEFLRFANDHFSKSEISTFSNHSLTKSVTLYHCFEYLINYSLRNTTNTVNKSKEAIKLDYVRYIHNYINFIDLSRFKGHDGERRFYGILVDLLLIKLNDDEQTNIEFVKFIFDFLFYIVSSKEKYVVMPSFIKSLLKIIETLKYTKITDENAKNYFFDMNLTIFQNIFDCIYSSSLIRKNKIWEYVFNAERWIPINDEKMISKFLSNAKINDINKSYTNLEKAQEYLNLHKIYLNGCKDALSHITEKNKDKYLVEFKNNYDVIGYVFVLHYLKEIKNYLRIAIK